jgi:hypothetical protein
VKSDKDIMPLKALAIVAYFFKFPATGNNGMADSHNYEAEASPAPLNLGFSNGVWQYILKKIAIIVMVIFCRMQKQQNDSA